MSEGPVTPVAAHDASLGALRIAVALYSDLDHDGRVLREAESLAAAGHRVTVYCLSWQGGSDVPFQVIAHTPARSGALPDSGNPFHRRTGSSRVRRLITRAVWMRDYWRNLRAWGRWAVDDAGTVDAWHVHDLPGLMAIAPRLGEEVPIVYDSHEIFLESGTAMRMPSLVRRLLARYERRLVRRAAAVVTVNEAEAEEMVRRVRPRRMVIVRNCPARWEPPLRPERRIRDAIGIAADVPLVLYHGALGPHRGLEATVAALSETGLLDAHLCLLGFGDIAALGIDVDDPRYEGRVHRLPAVLPAELLSWVVDADVDVMALQRSTLNHWLASPNKLWESLAAGVPVVVSDFPVMRAVVMDPKGPLGATCDPDDPASIAEAIRAVIDRPAADRQAMRDRCLAVAHDRWNWETEIARLMDVYAGFRPRI